VSLLDISHCSCCTSPGVSKNTAFACLEYALVKTAELVVSCEYDTGAYKLSEDFVTP
jgi:hypothetical protein